jgi:hypothetical protein
MREPIKNRTILMPTMTDGTPCDQGFPHFCAEGDREELAGFWRELEDWRAAVILHKSAKGEDKQRLRPQLEAAYRALKRVWLRHGEAVRA